MIGYDPGDRSLPDEQRGLIADDEEKQGNSPDNK